jgi:hypothetical protein
MIPMIPFSHQGNLIPAIRLSAFEIVKCNPIAAIRPFLLIIGRVLSVYPI